MTDTYCQSCNGYHNPCERGGFDCGARMVRDRIASVKDVEASLEAVRAYIREVMERRGMPIPNDLSAIPDIASRKR